MSDLLASVGPRSLVIGRPRAGTDQHPETPQERSGIAEPSEREPFRLGLEEGIAVYPFNVPNPARLPILGLRAIVQNNLTLTINGQSRHVSLRSASWFF